MASRSYQRWINESLPALDEIEAAHKAIGGTGRGRRYATQQINQAYVVILSSQFQRFCRELHSEAADHLGSTIANTQFRALVLANLVANRQLDRGNPNPGNIGSDFARLGMRFWTTINSLDQRNARRQHQLELLNIWRNAISHQDFTDQRLNG